MEAKSSFCFTESHPAAFVQRPEEFGINGGGVGTDDGGSQMSVWKKSTFVGGGVIFKEKL